MASANHIYLELSCIAPDKLIFHKNQVDDIINCSRSQKQTKYLTTTTKQQHWTDN